MLDDMTALMGSDSRSCDAIAIVNRVAQVHGFCLRIVMVCEPASYVRNLHVGYAILS